MLLVPFHDPKVQKVFEHYADRAKDEQEQIDQDGFGDRDDYLLPIGPETGRFLHSLIIATKPKRILEIGTSYGYSTVFLADAARAIGSKVISLDIVDYKQDYARKKLKEAGLSEYVDFRLGDSIELIEADPGPFDFVLIDVWKSLYIPCLDAIYTKLSEEGVIAADNMYYPQDTLEMTRAYRQAVKLKSDLQTTLIAIGSGIELTCRWPKSSEKL